MMLSCSTASLDIAVYVGRGTIDVESPGMICS